MSITLALKDNDLWDDLKEYYIEKKNKTCDDANLSIAFLIMVRICLGV